MFHCSPLLQPPFCTIFWLGPGYHLLACLSIPHSKKGFLGSYKNRKPPAQLGLDFQRSHWKIHIGKDTVIICSKYASLFSWKFTLHQYSHVDGEYLLENLMLSINVNRMKSFFLHQNPMLTTVKRFSIIPWFFGSNFLLQKGISSSFVNLKFQFHESII